MNNLKKVAIVLVASFVLTTFVGCGSGEAPSVNSNTENESTSSIEVEKRLLTVDVTLPQSFFSAEEDGENGKTPEQYAEDVKSEDGILGAIVNNDGSVTLTMTKAKHQEMMDAARQGIDEMIESYLADDSFPSIKEIEHNESYDIYTIKVDREAFEGSWDSLAALGFGITGMYYCYFDGVSDPRITVDFVDADTGNIIDEVVYPETTPDDKN